MVKKYVLGVDLGTTAIKAGLFDDQGNKVAAAAREHTLLTPQPLIVEQKADVYWDTFKAAITEVLNRSGVDKKDILSLSLSVQGETMVFLDSAMKPLHNFIVWMDTRPQEEADMINSWFTADELLNVTGQGQITALYPACKILWMKRHHPEIFSRICKILLLDDYFVFRMMGVFRAQGSNWCTSYLWNITTKKYWPEMLNRLELREDQLPVMTETSTPIGTILPEAAAELGLSENLILVMGGLDQSCGTIGVGNVRPGIFSENTGAALVVCTMSEKIVLDRGSEVPCYYGVIPNLYMLQPGAKGGIMYRWLRDVLCTAELEAEKAGGQDAYLQMDRQAGIVAAGADGLYLLPFFGGAGAPNTDQHAKGVLYGLGLQHRKAHIIRAFLEGIAVSIALMVEYCEKVTGQRVNEVRSLGGGAKSPIWCQIKADMLDRPVQTVKNIQDEACLGAALIAGVGAGLWPSIPAVTDRIVQIGNTFTPNPANRGGYDELIGKYKILWNCIKGKTQLL
jgi:xylulokinase